MRSWGCQQPLTNKNPLKFLAASAFIDNTTTVLWRRTSTANMNNKKIRKQGRPVKMETLLTSRSHTCPFPATLQNTVQANVNQMRTGGQVSETALDTPPPQSPFFSVSPNHKPPDFETPMPRLMSVLSPGPDPGPAGGCAVVDL